MLPTPPRKQFVAYRIGEKTKQLAIHEWGNPTATGADGERGRVLVCVHGLTRNGRDFDVIADSLARNYRVLSVDVPGRGESDRLDRVDDYVVPVYATIIAQVLSALRIKQYDWLGTSMGGLIGMVRAVTPGNGMRKFVCNDVGPHIERSSLERIAGYMRGRTPSFPSLEVVLAASRVALSTFGPMSEEQYTHLVRTSIAQSADGSWYFTLDPKIGEAFAVALNAPEVDLWPLWHAIKQPTLILRGEQSDLLSETTVARMLKEKTNAHVHRVANTGHAPALMDAPTIERIREFLLS